MSRHLDGTRTGHPFLRFLDVLEHELDDLKDAPAWSLNAAETTEVVERLTADLSRLAELDTRVLSQADILDLPGDVGVVSLAKWLQRVTRMTGTAANRRVKLVKALSAHEQTREAVAMGEVLPEQATVISGLVDDLDEEHAADAHRAEAFLIEQAAHHDAHDLQRMREKLFEVIDPDTAEAREAEKLADQEERARRKTELRMGPAGDGMVRGSFTIPELQAEMFRRALNALASPKHVRGTQGAGAYDYEKPTPQKLGQAFLEYVEGYPSDKLPRHGGLPATIVITAEADIFTTGASKPGRTESGTGVSPGQVLRLACEAKVMPAVLDTTGHVLDLGRTKRLHSPAQRTALLIEQKHCQADGCTVPGAFCHAHHTDPWSRGGHTNTRDAVLLCPVHHHQAHTRHVDYPLRR